MKSFINLFILMALVGLTSCETDDFADKKLSYLEYLNNKAIIAIHIHGETKYIFTSRYCDTCYVSTFQSHFPVIAEWTVINDSSYANYSPADFSGLPISDMNGNLYIVKGNIIYKLNANGEKEVLLNTGDYTFTTISFDNDNNIWAYGENNGLAFWDKSHLTVYNSQNSQLPTERIHGLKVDNNGIVWVSLDFKGLLKIENDNWIVIPNNEIPGLNQYSYLRGPKFIQGNSVWFEVFRPDTTSNIIRLENGNWIYEFPDNTEYCNIVIDSKGSIWSINHHYDVSSFKYSTLKYYSNHSWINFDVSNIDTRILTVNANDKTVFIGTSMGLIEKPLSL